MKQALVENYGKVFLTILLLGLGSYFHVDVNKAVDALGKLFADAPAREVAPAPAMTPDAGQ